MRSVKLRSESRPVGKSAKDRQALRSLKAPAPHPGNIDLLEIDKSEPVMNVHVLDIVFWIVGIRGHIPHHDDFRPGRSEPSLAGRDHRLMRMLATFAVSTALLALALWLAVWLALKLL